MCLILAFVYIFISSYPQIADNWVKFIHVDTTALVIYCQIYMTLLYFTLALMLCNFTYSTESVHIGVDMWICSVDLF